MAVSFKINTREFDKTLKEYYQFHKRHTVPDIVNKKALYIARGAMRETYRPNKITIGKALSDLVYVFKNTKKGAVKKLATRKTYNAFGAQSGEAPIAALIINFLRGKRGKKGLFGAEMKKAIKKLITKRQQAVAYLASGWIPAIKRLDPLVKRKSDAPAIDKDVRALKKSARGSGTAATEARPVAQIVSEAIASFSTTKDPLGKYGEPALQRAFDKETASMKQNIEDEMRKAARAHGIKTN